MRNFIACVLLLLSVLPCAAAAPDLTGVWRGGPVHILELAHKKGGGWRGELHYLGEDGGPLNGNPIAVTQTGQSIKLTLVKEGGSFEGILSADGNSFSGTLTIANKPEPVTFTRAAAGFVIDASPHKASFVTVDKGVKLEVLDWGGSGPPLVLLAGLGNT